MSSQPQDNLDFTRDKSKVVFERVPQDFRALDFSNVDECTVHVDLLLLDEVNLKI